MSQPAVFNVESLVEKRDELAAARRALAASKATLAEQQERFARETFDLTTQINRETTKVAAAEIIVRTLAIECFNATGEKKPVAGVEIKETRSFAVDAVAGLAWAKEKGMCLIPEQLDVDAVKKIAGVQPLPFVTVTKEPMPSIARDLEKVLASEGARSVDSAAVAATGV